MSTLPAEHRNSLFALELGPRLLEPGCRPRLWDGHGAARILDMLKATAGQQTP